MLPGAADTIAAVATARGRGAIAVVRVSGARSRVIGAAVLDPFRWDAGRAYLATLRSPADHAPVDRVIVTVFGAPRSFTGEDALEIATHGGHFVPALALRALLDAGAREALPGEFSRRAVANGKLDLLQVEALADLVDARTPSMHRVALRQMDGRLTARIAVLRQAVLELEALLAFDIDFPDEDQGAVPRARILAAAHALAASLEGVLATARTGEILREGALVVLAGPPNSGKSSLFNALVGASRAIVTDQPGTTRDALRHSSRSATGRCDWWTLRGCARVVRRRNAWALKWRCAMSATRMPCSSAARRRRRYPRRWRASRSSLRAAARAAHEVRFSINKFFNREQHRQRWA